MNAFLQSTQHKAVKTGWYGVGILCPRTATCLHAEFCLCVLDTTISNSWHCSSVKPGIIVTISSNVTFRRYIADINYYLVWSNNHRFLVGFVLLNLIVLCVLFSLPLFVFMFSFIFWSLYYLFFEFTSSDYPFGIFKLLSPNENMDNNINKSAKQFTPLQSQL